MGSFEDVFDGYVFGGCLRGVDGSDDYGHVMWASFSHVGVPVFFRPVVNLFQSAGGLSLVPVGFCFTMVLINFNLDPAMREQLQSAPGVVLVDALRMRLRTALQFCNVVRND